MCPCSDTWTTDDENKNALSNEEFHIHVNERTARNTVNLDRNQQRCNLPQVCAQLRPLRLPFAGV